MSTTKKKIIINARLKIKKKKPPILGTFKIYTRRFVGL